MTTHNFNLTDKEKEKIENIVDYISEVILNESSASQAFARGILELIYNEKQAQQCLDYLKRLWFDDKLNIQFNTFFQIFQDDKKIQKLFTKKL